MLVKAHHVGCLLISLFISFLGSSCNSVKSKQPLLPLLSGSVSYPDDGKTYNQYIGEFIRGGDSKRLQY